MSPARLPKRRANNFLLRRSRTIGSVALAHSHGGCERFFTFRAASAGAGNPAASITTIEIGSPHSGSMVPEGPRRVTVGSLMGSITLTYNKAFGVLLLVAALFILGVAVLTGKMFPQAISGGILALASIGYLTQPAFVIAAGGVQVKNLLGMTMRTVPFSTWSELTLRDGQLYARDQRVKVARWLISASDWALLERKIREASTSS
jgi:hypothetical protein